MNSVPQVDSAVNPAPNYLAVTPSPAGPPSFSVSYGKIEAGIFPQVGNAIKYASFDRAGEIVASMPDSAKNTLLAPIQQGLIDPQSVFYLIDNTKDGVQVAISVEDFIELASSRVNEAAAYEELPRLEGVADNAMDTLQSHRLGEHFPPASHQQRTAVSNVYSAANTKLGASSPDTDATDGIVIPPRLLDALLEMSSTRVHPFRTNKTPPSIENGPSQPEYKPPTTNGNEYGYDNFEPPWKKCIRLGCGDQLGGRRRRLTVASLLLMVILGLVAGAMVLWVFPSTLSKSSTSDPSVRTTTQFQPPQDSTVRCMKALCNATSGYCQSEAAINFHEQGSERGCRDDGAAPGEGDGCGWYLIHKLYHTDCSKDDPGIMEDWYRCALDYECATRCVTQYYRLYNKRCPESMDRCECLVRNHMGGPSGSKSNKTIENWEKVKAMLEKH